MTSIRLVSVNVGLPAVIGTRRGRPVRSGIVKRPVTGVETLKLSELNLEGDRQADLSVHGGPEKAVYAYASEHLPAWRAELARPDVAPAFFGENLSTEGVIESDVAIGDVWAWGDALLQVAQPRWPCFKLTMRSGVPDMAARFRGSGRTGWYLRVLRGGEVPVAGPITVTERHPAGVTILDAHHAALPGAATEHVERVLSVALLSPEWRRHISPRVR
ncbi:MAG: MOSC domain-containing protein [Actinomycetota bacterium]|nr:MOSC domain-containing protein [Actinomycetota bacterium]